MARGFGKISTFLWVHVALVSCRRARPQLTAWNPFARSKQGAGSDHGAGFDNAPIHNGRPHPNDRAILQGAAMDKRHMTHRYVVTNDGAVGSPADVHHRAVLNIAAGPDPDQIDITPQDAIVPNAAAGPDFNVTNDFRPRRDKYPFAEFWMSALERQNQTTSHVGTPP